MSERIRRSVSHPEKQQQYPQEYRALHDTLLKPGSAGFVMRNEYDPRTGQITGQYMDSPGTWTLKGIVFEEGKGWVALLQTPGDNGNLLEKTPTVEQYLAWQSAGQPEDSNTSVVETEGHIEPGKVSAATAEAPAETIPTTREAIDDTHEAVDGDQHDRAVDESDSGELAESGKPHDEVVAELGAEAKSHATSSQVEEVSPGAEPSGEAQHDAAAATDDTAASVSTAQAMTGEGGQRTSISEILDDTPGTTKKPAAEQADGMQSPDWSDINHDNITRTDPAVAEVLHQVTSAEARLTHVSDLRSALGDMEFAMQHRQYELFNSGLYTIGNGLTAIAAVVAKLDVAKRRLGDGSDDTRQKIDRVITWSQQMKDELETTIGAFQQLEVTYQHAQQTGDVGYLRQQVGVFTSQLELLLGKMQQLASERLSNT